MRVIDTIPHPGDPFLKNILVEDHGEYAILRQVQGRTATTAEEHLNEEVAFVFWRKMLTAAFYAISHNPSDSLKLAERRLKTLH